VFDSQYWAKATAGMDFSAEDPINFDGYNEILWKGLMGNRPYPKESTGKDLRQNRVKLQARYQKRQRQKTQDQQN
jgi:hypothetical protein